MSAFDVYEPVPPLACPVCSAAIARLEGYDGPQQVLLWRQGHAAPLAQLAPKGDRLPDEKVAEFRLPALFTLVGKCPNGHAVEAEGSCDERGWTDTVVVASGRSVHFTI
jgi:hypothetical protein